MRNLNSSHGFLLRQVSLADYNKFMESLESDTNIKCNVFVYYDACGEIGELRIEALRERRDSFIQAVKLFMEITKIDNTSEEDNDLYM